MTKLVALTGAGISKASGIPTFEEMGDLREKLSRWYFIEHPQEFYKILIEMKDKTDAAKPNEAHMALAEYNIPIVTMNIDGLHKKAGSKNVIEIHGNLEYVTCNKCREKHDFSVVKDSIYCRKCGRLLEPNVVLYGDSIPLYFDAINLVGSADTLLVVGTSFYTSTSGELVNRAKMAGIRVNIINEKSEEKVPLFLEKLFNDRSDK